MFPSALLLAYANWRFCPVHCLRVPWPFLLSSCSRALAPHHLICCCFARIWSVCRAGVLRCVNYHLDSLSGVLSVGVWGEFLDLLIVAAVNEAVHSQSKRKCNSCALLRLATKLQSACQRLDHVLGRLGFPDCQQRCLQPFTAGLHNPLKKPENSKNQE